MQGFLFQKHSGLQISSGHHDQSDQNVAATKFLKRLFYVDVYGGLQIPTAVTKTRRPKTRRPPKHSGHQNTAATKSSGAHQKFQRSPKYNRHSGHQKLGGLQKLGAHQKSERPPRITAVTKNQSGHQKLGGY